MTRYRLQAVGYCGGFTRIGLDTSQELEQAIPAAFARNGLTVKAISMDADGWDVISRVFSNQFHYSVTLDVESDKPSSVVTSLTQSTMTGLTDLACTVSNLTAGDPGQEAPNSNPIPNILDLATMPALVMTVLAVAVAYIVFKID